MADKSAVIELSEEVKQRRDLILRNLQEYLGTDKLEKQLSTEGKVPHVYWGTATTGRPHVGYLVPMQKIADILQAGLKVTILFADLHAFLDNMKSTWELLENRVIYYEHVIKSLLQSLDIPIDRLHFVRGTTFQLSREYTFDLLRLCGQVSQRDASRAGAEVVKQVQSPLLSGLLYPLLQALDEQYLKVDGQFGGVDQRKIFILAEEQLPKLKLGKRWHLMNPLIPGLTGGKMSSSEEDSKIDLLDSPDIVSRKIMSAYCPREADNGVLSFINYVLMPIAHKVTLNNKEYTTFESVKEDFLAGRLDEKHLKQKLSDFAIDLLTKVQDRCDNDAVHSALEKGYQNISKRKTELPARSPIEISEAQEKVLHTMLEGSELIGSDHSIRSSLVDQRPFNIVFPIHPKGKFHLGFISGLLKFKRLLDAGLNISAIVLISDMEAFLDDEKVSWGAKEARAEYFRKMVESFIKTLRLQDSVKIVLSSELEGYFNSDYVLDMYKMACAVTRDETSLCKGTSLAGNLVPLFYALNIRLSNADLILVGNEPDAKKVAQLSIKLLNSIGSHAPAQVTVPVIPGCDGQKMGCRSADFLLDPLDTSKQIKTKIARSFCEPQNLSGNVAMQLAKVVMFPLLSGRNLEISRSEDNGGNVSVSNYEALEKEFLVGSNADFPLHPADLKNAVVNSINGVFDPVRADLAPVQQKLLAAAFPSNKGGKKK